MMMTQEEAIAKIWAIECRHEIKLILLGLAISRFPAFAVNDDLVEYLHSKLEHPRPLIQRFIDALDACGAFEPTEPEGYVVLNLNPEVVEAIREIY